MPDDHLDGTVERERYHAVAAGRINAIMRAMDDNDQKTARRLIWTTLCYAAPIAGLAGKKDKKLAINIGGELMTNTETQGMDCDELLAALSDIYRQAGLSPRSEAEDKNIFALSQGKG